MRGGIVSWEHFFHSLHAYLEHLKREVPSVETRPFRTQPAAAPKTIIPRELEGLRAVLKLTATIAQQVMMSMIMMVTIHDHAAMFV